MITDIGRTGRVVGRVKAVLAGKVSRGEWPVGAWMPSVRQLGLQFGVSPRTAHAALKALAEDGALAVESCRGYRVIKALPCLERASAIAYILESADEPGAWDGLHRLLANRLQETALTRGWPLHSYAVKGRTPADILASVQSGSVWGAVLDISAPPIEQALRTAGVPCVLIDCGLDRVESDIVMQDGQTGGAQATEYLVARGCRRIAWAGNTRVSAHSRDRLSGALLGLHCAGLGAFGDGMLADMDPLNPDRISDIGLVRAKIRALLSRRERPDGILALWASYARLVCEEAVNMGLTVGRDLHVVGWSEEELYETDYVRGFPGRPPPAIVWKAGTMVETAVARLAERREFPDLPPLRIKIPTRLHGCAP